MGGKKGGAQNEEKGRKKFQILVSAKSQNAVSCASI